MVQICIMFDITINNDTYPGPSTWNELTYDQLINLCHFAQPNVPANEFKTQFLLSILGLRTLIIEERYVGDEVLFYFKKGKKTIYILSNIDIACILYKFDFLFLKKEYPDGNIQYQFNSHLTKNLIPEIKINGITYYGPADSLTNILFHEYIVTETNLVNYYQTQDEKFLNNLIAALYREEDPQYNPTDIAFSGDRRKPFNDFQIEARANAISKLDPKIKQAILFFYDGCRNYLKICFPEVFEGSGSGDNENIFKLFMKLVTALTNNDITKNEQVRKSYLYEVMISLQEMKIQSNKIKEDIEKLKRK